MKAEIDFEIGEECIFTEDGGSIRCEILERELKDNQLRLKLKAIEIIVPSTILFARQAESGEIFEVSKTLGYCIPGMLWTIS